MRVCEMGDIEKERERMRKRKGIKKEGSDSARKEENRKKASE